MPRQPHRPESVRDVEEWVRNSDDIDPHPGELLILFSRYLDYADVEGIVGPDYQPYEVAPRPSYGAKVKSRRPPYPSIWYVGWTSRQGRTTPDLEILPRTAEWQDIDEGARAAFTGARTQHGSILPEGERIPLDEVNPREANILMSATDDLAGVLRQ